MPKPKVTFGKITGVANPHAWAQTYHAGTLAAVVALNHEASKKDTDAVTLHVIGKEAINNLEAEYFTIENKNLHAIKQAITDTYSKIPKSITATIIVGAIVQNILYIFLYGSGRAYIKRKGKLGILLENTHEEKDMLSASGYLQNNDVIVLATEQFSQIISQNELEKHLGSQSPDEIAEILLPKVHVKQRSDAAAIIFSYHNENILDEKIPDEKPLTEVTVVSDDKKTDVEVAEKLPVLSTTMRKKIRFFPKFSYRLSLRKSIFLFLALGIGCILIGSIYLTIKTQEISKRHTLFNQITSTIQKKYDEGQSVVGLNPKMALNDFTSVKKILKDAQGKFPPNSSESQQISELLQKVDNSISNIPQHQTPQIQPVENSKSLLLSTEIDSNGNAFTQDNDTVYYIDNEGIKSVDSSKNTKTILKNNGDWSDPAGLGTYLGNFYVLDRKSNQVLKYISSGGNYSKSNYFPSSPDLSKASGMTNDTSIWIITSDGKIMKYTRGIADKFSINGLDKPLLNPTRIYTNVNIELVYILDNGNGRVVVLDKSGNFQNQYTVDVVKNAKDFDVEEKDKKVYLLNDKKIYGIDLK